MKRALIGMVVAVALAVFAWQAWLGRATAIAPMEEDPLETFLNNHWNHPLPPQGTPRPEASALESSLGAQACGQCHTEQWEAWRTSLHSQAMGPGIHWQLRLMDQAQGNRCLRCHAPLAEQKALVALEHGWSAVPTQPRPEYIPADLHQQGVACAVCHVRDHERLGPPARPESRLEGTAHQGFTAHDAFADSRFCATCHQFPEDGPRLAGKLQEDTFAQWQASTFAGLKSCQQCHMPDRRHLFRGIHDPATVREAVKLELATFRENGRGAVRVTVSNVGAGHHFPTYMVPKVYVRLNLHGPNGEIRLLGEEVIGWGADVGITREWFDTRIPAGGRFEFERSFPLPEASGWRVSARLDVAPREHYERVFAHSLQQAGRMDAETVADLRRALDEARRTRFEAMSVSRSLDALLAAHNQAAAARCAHEDC
ncbi:MAG: cytochrome c family protein [Gammaproteobacteria bacterium]|nr:cytochrome c family protein [Gammaproteobacteria bacterium]